MLDDPERHFRVKLETRLKELGVWYRFIQKPQSTVHTADAASLTGIALHRISKNLVARTVDGRSACLILPGDMRVDHKAAARALGTKSVSLVPFSEAHKLSGYPPGGTPSIGYEMRLQVVLDQELMKYETFYCGGGSTRMLLEVRRDEVIRTNNATIFKISQPGR